MNLRKFLSTLYIILSLVGCDFGGRSSTTETTSDDGQAIYSSKTRTWDDHARFECRESSSGYCHFLVFTSDCPGGNCGTSVVTAFSLAPGESRELDSLPRDYRYCLDHIKPPVAPNCKRT
jgi:hypothetical protein